MSKSKGLRDLITEAELLALAGERAFARGVGYFQSGAVADLVETGTGLRATVVGSDEYQVRLWPAKGALDYGCTCPVGEDGDFCKHAVAAGLAWLGGQDPDGATHSGAKSGADTLRSYLRAQDKDALVALLIEQADSDSALRSHLEIRAAEKRARENPGAVRDAIRKALGVHGGVDYHGTRRYLARVYPVLDLISGLLRRRDASAAFEAAEYALRQGLAAYEKIDDSGGGFGEVLRQMADLHLQAARKAAPEGDALAKSLFELQMRDQWGFFRFQDYAPLLGKIGLARYRKLAETAWARVSPLNPGDRRNWSDDARSTVTGIMEALARHSGDTDALVAVMSRNLSSSHAFLEIAQVLEGAGRHEEALNWAERGHKAFKDELHVPLTEFLVTAYHRAKRDDEAITFAWEHFCRWPSLSAYQGLKKSADRIKSWSGWREKALGRVRNSLKAVVGKCSPWDRTAGGHSLLVEIFLWESDSDAALAEARAGGCREDLWFKLAAALEKDHPQDAIAIYQARIDSIIDRKDNRAYDEAADLVRKIQALAGRAGKNQEFAAWLEGVRASHKPKRNFMQRLDRVAKP